MAALVEKHGVRRTLFKMALPMLAGTFAMNAYNLADTYFVSRLGTEALAAMAFTFPVVMLITCVARGLGTGIMVVVSHALGAKDDEAATRYATHGFIMTLLLMTAIAAIGLATIKPLFTQLNADEHTLPLVAAYMNIWYLGAMFMALPMIGCDLMIATGDSKKAGLLMMMGTLINLALDPIMIFGYFGMPAMGISGAALATVIAQFIWFCAVVFFLIKKYRLLKLVIPRMGEFLRSCKKELAVGLPSILSIVMMPLSAGVLTRLYAGFGTAVVAAVGAAGRLEMFAFMVPMTVGISLVPFTGQNYGAGRIDRVREGWRSASWFAGVYGLIAALVFVIFARLLAGIFSDDPAVIDVLALYVRIIAFGYGALEIHRYCGFCLTGLNRPFLSAMMNMVRILLLLIPLSYAGKWIAGVPGVFAGRLLTDIIAAIIAVLIVRAVLRRLLVRPAPAPRPNTD